MEMDYKKVLDEIVEKKGIDLIREYLKDYDKKQKEQTKKTRDNDNLEVALIYYKYRSNGLRAKDAKALTAKDARTGEKNVEGHITRFNKKANDIDYMNFGAMIEEYYNELVDYSYFTLDELKKVIKKEALKYRILYKLAEASYYRYLTDKNDMKVYKDFIRDYSKYNLLNIDSYKKMMDDKSRIPF